ncbi:MAG: carbamoyltransferase HypF [Planctomycetia bacterium]|nr:carbamoyltransferase HypF [Planctomycetia bacterium]
MPYTSPKPTTDRRLAIAVRGVVQGVGFRPFVYNAARTRGLAGWVRNEADTVRIEVQGDGGAIEGFLEALRDDAPPQAAVEAIEIQDVGCLDEEPGAFEIHASRGHAAPRPTIPADLATCAACLEEIHAPGMRRHEYPFTNCTNCGPRWSIIESLPYDRSRTSMAGFAMCPACAEEYGDTADRRFHAQPIACPRCCPELRLLDAAGGELARREEALAGSVKAVLDGRIVALKGLGGFQLIVDATNAEAVARLRRRKHRPDKPLAVMLPSLDAVRWCCEVSDAEAGALTSHQRPILLLRRIAGDKTVAEAVAPGNPYLGVMLPYTPLHHLLMDRVGRPVVCTSGNLSEEPMATTTAEAVERLGPIADVILTHNRPIVRPVDDSVAQVGPDGVQLLRRARGYAPRPIELGVDGPTVLAVGGHLKNAVALRLGSQVVLGAHVGDLDSLESVEVHRRAVRDLVAFFDVVPERVACDLHPDYASTRHAESLAAEWGVPLVRVQHHHAHVASAMAEHRLIGPVLGLAWDGTGYGTDGTVWGGEALCCRGAAFSRVAHLRTFALPGGDRAVREPRRSALGALWETMPEYAAGIVADWYTATELQFAADPNHGDAYSIPLAGDAPAVADWGPLVAEVIADVRAGVPVGWISARFHNALAALAVAIARHAGCSQVVLTGGCFQNALLTRRVRAALLASDFNVYTHREVPPGDGGIALGQALVAGIETRG